jgi:hypothetical protein
LRQGSARIKQASTDAKIYAGDVQRLRILCISDSETGWFDTLTLLDDVKVAGVRG